MVGNNNSNLDVPAVNSIAICPEGFAFTWLPTTHEFGLPWSFGDFEDHEKITTRFNLAYTYSPEDRQAALGTGSGNTTLRLADSLNVFDPNTFVEWHDGNGCPLQVLAESAGMKYHGFWLQGEGDSRWLDHFVANGPMPVNSVFRQRLLRSDCVHGDAEETGAVRCDLVGLQRLWESQGGSWGCQLLSVEHQECPAKHAVDRRTSFSCEQHIWLLYRTADWTIFSFGMTAMY